MMHGPFGVLNPTCPYMEKKSCKFNYPKYLSENTKYGQIHKQYIVEITIMLLLLGARSLTIDGP